MSFSPVTDDPDQATGGAGPALSANSLALQQTTFRPLANYLIRGTLVFSIVSMLLVLSAQSLWMVQSNSKQFEQVVDEIASTAVPLLSVGLWDIELKAVQQQVDLIAQRPQIGHVALTATIGKQFTAGQAALRDGPVSLRIKIPAPGGSGTVGELALVGNQQYLIDQVVRNAWTVFVGYSVFTALVCSFIIFILRRELQRPLQRIAQFASEITPQTLTTPLLLERPNRDNIDEIDLVADGFSKLQNGLREHINHLDKLVEDRTHQLSALAEANRVLSITDDLTGCLNRRTLELRLREEIGRCQRYDRKLSVICLDLDHFKRVNDTLGHAAGDAVLKSMGQQLRAMTRQNLDWIVRMGGEEFLLVLPETELAPAAQHAERLRLSIAQQPIHHDGERIHVTVSMGVAQWLPPESGQGLVMRADHLLYAAKDAGRNRVLSKVDG